MLVGAATCRSPDLAETPGLTAILDPSGERCIIPIGRTLRRVAVKVRWRPMTTDPGTRLRSDVTRRACVSITAGAAGVSSRVLEGDPGAISASPQVVGIPAFESAVDVVAECQREFDRAGHEAGEPDRRCDLDQDVDDLLGGQAGRQRSGDRPFIGAPRTTDRKESSEPNQCCRSVIEGRVHAF